MPVTEEGRHRLHQALDRTIGPEEATTLMEHLPPVGWADVATKTDLAHLEERLGARFEAIDTRFEAIDTRFEMIDVRFDAAKAYSEHLFAIARLDTEHLLETARRDTKHITESIAAHAKATNESIAAHAKATTESIAAHAKATNDRLDDMAGWMRSMENRLTHQFWQFLTLVVAVGAILIGVLRYT